MNRSQKEIDTDVSALRSVKPRVPEFTGFGDNNHEAINVQIEVLERRRSEDWCYTTFPPGSAELDHALHAVLWVCCEEDEAPSFGWVELAEAIEKPRLAQRKPKRRTPVSRRGRGEGK